MNAQLRENLAGRLAERLADGHHILGRWAVALTASETYTEIFDQHVELYGRVDGLLRFLRERYPQTDPLGFRNGARREYSSPGGGGRCRVVRRQPHWDQEHRRQAGSSNLGAPPACAAASGAGSSYGRSRRRHAVST